MKPIKLDPCPFCGWERGKILEKVVARGGRSLITRSTKSKVRVQVMCNRCHSRGRPFTSDWIENYGNWMTLPYLKQKKMVRPYVDKAVEAWNRRASDE